VKWSNLLYTLAGVFFGAGVMVEIFEIKEREKVWEKAGANGTPSTATVEPEAEPADKAE
jgi:hypothetical protein